MRFEQLPIIGAYLIHLDPVTDNRGFFCRTHCKEIFLEQNLETNFNQESICYNEKKFTLRGLHYQCEPFAEVKTVFCLSGKLFDVILDYRKSSPSFGKYFSIELDANKLQILYIPKGCAHGYLTLLDNTRIFYQIAGKYNADYARGFNWQSKSLDINWPNKKPIMSKIDQCLPEFTLNFLDN